MTGHRLTLEGADGNALAATMWGAGLPPVLLLHGGGQTRHAFSGTARKLAEHGFRAIAADQRGHGDSAWTQGYLFADYARDVAAMAGQIEAHFGARPVAVGASMGGIASLLALGGEPGVLAGLVLVDVTPRLQKDGVARVQGFMRTHARDGFATIEEAADAVAAYLPHRPRPKSLEGLRKNLRHREDGRWYWHWDPRFMEGDGPEGPDPARLEAELLAAARSLAVPTLLVRGAQSELVGDAQAQEFLSLAPQAEFADIAGARHMVAGDRNDVFSEAIVDFLQRRFHGRG